MQRIFVILPEIKKIKGAKKMTNDYKKIIDSYDYLCLIEKTIEFVRSEERLKEENGIWKVKNITKEEIKEFLEEMIEYIEKEEIDPDLIIDYEEALTALKDLEKTNIDFLKNLVDTVECNLNISDEEYLEMQDLI